MTYYTPLEFSKYIIDVFLYDGEKIIIDILIRIIIICRSKILSIDKMEDLFNFLRKDIMHYTFTNYGNKI